MLRIENLLLLFLLLVLSACSTTAKGPITNKEYRVQMGGWQDMNEYNQARDQAVRNKTRTGNAAADCSVPDCPNMKGEKKPE